MNRAFTRSRTCVVSRGSRARIRVSEAVLSYARKPAQIR